MRNAFLLLGKGIKMSTYRYNFGYSSYSDKNCKRHCQATYNRQKSIFTRIVLILLFVVFPLGFILKFGCIEQLVIFLIFVAFSFIVDFSIDSLRLERMSSKN